MGGTDERGPMEPNGSLFLDNNFLKGFPSCMGQGKSRKVMLTAHPDSLLMTSSKGRVE